MVCGKYLVKRSRKQLPAPLNSHWWAAFAWTILTFVLTSIFASSTDDTTWLAGAIIQFIAGWCMVLSWRDLYHRKRMLLSEPNALRPTPRHLLLRTIAGPFAALVLLGTLTLFGSTFVNRAVTKGDLVSIGMLQNYHFSAADPDGDLQSAVDHRDLRAASTAIEAGATPIDNTDDDSHLVQTVIDQTNIGMMALLLRYRCIDPQVAIMLAAGAGNTAEVRFLIWRGVDVRTSALDSTSQEYITPLAAARKYDRQDMVRLLKSAGATQ